MISATRQNIAWSMVSVIAKNGLTLITFMVLSRLMEPDAFGLISIALIAWGIALAFVDSGFTSVIVRQKELNRDFLSSLYWFNILIGTIVAGMLALSGPFLAAFFHDTRLQMLLSVAALTIFSLAIGQQFIAVLQQQVLFSTIAIIEIGSSIIGFTVSIVAAYLGSGPDAYFEGLFAGTVFLSIAAFFSAKRYFTPRFSFTFSQIRPILSFGIFNTSERCINFASGNLEKPLIGRLFSLENLGLYSIVNQLITRPVTVISAAFSRVAYSIYSKVQNDHATLNQLYIAYSGKIALITFPMYGFLYLFSTTIIHLLFGDRFLPATTFMAPLCFLGALWSIGNPFGSYLMALNKTKIGFILNCISAVVTIVILWIGSHFSFQIMFILWVLAIVLLMLPLEWALRYRLTKMSLGRYLGSVLPQGIVVLGLCAGGTFLRAHLHYSYTLLHTTIEILTYGLIYGTFGWAMFKRLK